MLHTLLTPERIRFLRFCLVGFSGVFVNEFVLWLCYDHLLVVLSPGAATTHLHDLVAELGAAGGAPALAAESFAAYLPAEFTNTNLFLSGNRLTWSGFAGIFVAIFTNFLLNNAWTWRDRRQRGALPFLIRLAKYYAVASVAGAVQWTMLKVLTESFGIYYLISNLIGIAAGLVINFVINNLWTFR